MAYFGSDPTVSIPLYGCRSSSVHPLAVVGVGAAAAAASLMALAVIVPSSVDHTSLWSSASASQMVHSQPLVASIGVLPYSSSEGFSRRSVKGNRQFSKTGSELFVALESSNRPSTSPLFQGSTAPRWFSLLGIILIPLTALGGMWVHHIKRKQIPLGSQWSMVAMGAAKAPNEFIKESIAAHDIVIFGKSVDRLGSVTTDQVKRVAYQHDIQIHNLDKMDDGEAIQSALVEMTGVKGLPNVFVKGQCVGGNEATQRAVRTGKFMAMVTGQPGPIAMMSMSGGPYIL